MVAEIGPAEYRCVYLSKILLVGALVAAVLVVVKDGRVLAHARLLSACTQVTRPGEQEAAYQVCRKGRLDGYPDLTNKSCVPVGIVRSRQMWRCPVPVVASHAVRP